MVWHYVIGRRLWAFIDWDIWRLVIYCSLFMAYWIEFSQEGPILGQFNASLAIGRNPCMNPGQYLKYTTSLFITSMVKLVGDTYSNLSTLLKAMIAPNLAVHSRIVRPTIDLFDFAKLHRVRYSGEHPMGIPFLTRPGPRESLQCKQERN